MEHLKTKLENIKSLFNELTAYHDFTLARQQKIKVDVQNSKNWLQKQPKISTFLQSLQYILHEKNVGQFNQLLTAFVDDVIGTDKQIQLELYTSHNLPALKINALNNGKPEKITSGALNNIIATGLKLIALSRLSNRRFIVLDEPHCWTKPEKVPAFVKVIDEISKILKTQIILISHHDSTAFKDIGRVIQLTKEGSYITSDIIYDTPFENDDNYIKSLHLKNVMSHKDTLLSLHPNVTCIVGENDIGKSAIVESLRAVIYGDSDDSIISHDSNESSVVIEVDNQTVFWQRFRKTNTENPQKVRYRMYGDESSEPLHDEYNSQEAPKCIKELFKIETFENIDVNIGSQFEPSFILSPSIKAQDKAKILSLGNESILLQKIMETLKEKTRTHKNREKDGEKEYQKIEDTLPSLSNLPIYAEQLKTMDDSYEEISINNKTIEDLSLNLLQTSASMEIVNIGKQDNISETPKLHNTEALSLLIDNMKIYSNMTKIIPIRAFNTNVIIDNDNELNSFLINYKKYDAISKISKINTKIISPQVNDISILEKLGTDIFAVIEKLQTMVVKKNNLLNERGIIEDKTKQLISEHGNICGECGSPVTIDNYIHFTQ